MSIKEQVSIKEVIDLLNSACKADKSAMGRLVNTRVPCNEDMLNHPTVQIGGTTKSPSVGLLGVLNGIFGTDSDQWGTIAAEFKVICPKDQSHLVTDQLVGQRCPVCGCDLIEGDLIGFCDLGRR